MQHLDHQPDLILYNARIYTVEPAQPWAQAIAIRKHRIVAIGDDSAVRALAGPATQAIDLDGRLVLPGLCDAHIHFYNWCLRKREVALADCRSKAEMLQRIADRATSTPSGGWITGQGWNESRWGETAFPTVMDLDSVTGADQPAIFWRSDMHGAVANSAAMRLAGVTAATPNPPGGVIEHNAAGAPTGVFKELAIDLIARHIPLPDEATLDAALLEGMGQLHRLGVTAIHDQRMKDHDEGPRALAAYQRLRHKHQLQLRVNCNVAAHNLPHLAALGVQSGFGDDYLRLGHVKVFSDGSLGSRTAWMLEPFARLAPDETDNYGVVLTPPAQMAREFRQAVELGFPISVHAIGDRANRVVLDIFEELADSGLQPIIPHRIEHAQTLDPADVARFAQLGVTASVQPIHCTDDMDTADLLLGERGAAMYRFRSLADSGALLALGSDAPVAAANPFLGFHAALYRQRVERMAQPPWYEDERLTLEQTIYGYTLGAARASRWDRVIGSLRPGKRADLIVLDRNLFDLVAQGVTSNEIAATQVLMTLFDGNIVYAAGLTP
jgi:predicted amidohydrolase YtcJ